ncbi:hypothetical protein KIN20_023770 [Parelaphostrongylus tenuis]|uniref:Uncharacterized protein n=1 Tax=Parelaphostrongylus tenuis TaxID=148309 RepID=A0AAD5MS86_PARTN|nr:hypothetical protein KIN20_023770 [Parelaphostrongylus tenuis]
MPISSPSQIRSFVCLNIIGWPGIFYKQLRELAMGQRLAPRLAIAFMSKIKALYSISNHHSTADILTTALSYVQHKIMWTNVLNYLTRNRSTQSSPERKPKKIGFHSSMFKLTFPKMATPQNNIESQII